MSLYIEQIRPPNPAPPQDSDGDSRDPDAWWSFNWFRLTPSWLVSMVVHTTILLILALVPIEEVRRSAAVLFLGNDTGDGTDAELGNSVEFELAGPLQEVELTTPDNSTNQELREIAQMLESTEQQLTMTAVEMATSKLSTDAFDQSAASSVGIATSIASALSGRLSDNRGKLLGSGGGSAKTESAVELGLNWLAEHQHANGYWSLTGQTRDRSTRYTRGGVRENQTGATAMALNAFLGAGYTHKGGKYRDTVQRGLKFLLKRQSSNGFFAGGEPSQQQAYAQAIATITILEAYGLTGDSTLREPAELAIQYAQWAQSPRGGWRYEPRSDSDVSVTGWFVMALETAKMVGLKVDEGVLDSADKYLDTVAHHEGAAYSYNEIQGPDLSMTAEGILCRMLMGWPKTHPSLMVGVNELVRHPPSPSSNEQSVYFWYYATQVLHHFGGEPWGKWNDEMKQSLPAMQVQDGPERGSWDPERDHYSVPGGRLYTTCLCIYCLEVYYRHLAIYSVE